MTDNTLTGAELGLRFFRDERFHEFHPRVYDSEETRVLINQLGDFAVLNPPPVMDYSRYRPRSEALNLADPKKTRDYLALRLEASERLVGALPSDAKILEIGANDGAFLKLLRAHYPSSALVGIEPSEPHRTAARALGIDLVPNYSDLQATAFDFIFLFHTFEHFTDPMKELATISALLSPKGVTVIEIPALSDPLLSLYEIPEFRNFYFQRQHPYVYSESSILRLLQSAGMQVSKVLPVQRYGLANHLQWLTKRSPGTLLRAAEVFAPLEKPYKDALESVGMTDTLFLAFAPAR